MIKKKALRKIYITTFSCFILFVLYLIPSKINNNYLDITTSVEYTSSSFNSEVYLIGENNYLVRSNIFLSSTETIDKIKEILEHLKINSKYTPPTGLKAIIPENTNIISVDLDGTKAIINFSKDLLNIDQKLEERLIEAIVYSVTTLDNIDKITIKVDGSVLQLLPKTKKNIKEELTREFGINKVYDITSRNGIKKVTIYYLENISNNNYYVPVTKYINDDREKINIIIDNLSSNYIYEDNLMSYLSRNVSLLNYEEKDNTLEMNFNSNIFDTSDKLLEASEYLLSYSIFENYDVEKLVIKVNDNTIKEIDKCNVTLTCNNNN